MRRLALGMFVLVLLATTAAADPEGGHQAEALATPPHPGVDISTAAPLPSPAFSLGLPPLALDISAPTATGRPAELFPPAVFDFDSAPRRTSERSPAVQFGGGWQRDALTIGGLAAGFAALAALCSGGACLLPKQLGSWIPGTTTPAPPGPARSGPRLGSTPTIR